MAKRGNPEDLSPRRQGAKGIPDKFFVFLALLAPWRESFSGNSQDAEKTARNYADFFLGALGVLARVIPLFPPAAAGRSAVRRSASVCSRCCVISLRTRASR